MDESPPNPADPVTRSATPRTDAPTITAAPGGVVPGDLPADGAMLVLGQVFGAYRIIRLLGRGGMGEVYEAEERENGRRVALKLFNRPLTSLSDRERFLREGRLAASVSHPNSVYIFGTDEIQGVPTLAMELVPGGTLKDIVKSRGPLPAREAVDAMLQVIDGLEAAAAVGVLHRDVKPANCFVDRRGRVKVGDFGLSMSTLARDETHLTIAGTILGTPSFASPEQLQGDELDVRSDIYAVGATLYYLLTGRPPFDEPNVLRLVGQVLKDVPASPALANPSARGSVAAVVMRCLRKRPADRPQSYDELRRALLPSSSQAPTVATLGLRFAASVLDMLVCAVAMAPITLRGIRIGYAMGTGQAVEITATQMLTGMVVSLVVWFTYFAIMEGLWGRSLGKWVLGLRVVDANRERPGIRRALLRTLVYMAGIATISTVAGTTTIAHFWGRAGSVVAADMPWWTQSGDSISFVVGLLVLFAPARRRNGYAGLHELASGTRVVGRHAVAARPAVPARQPGAAVAAGEACIGPYRVIARDRMVDGSEVITGFDERLKRKVWIRPGAAGRVAGAARRGLARPARARWLTGVEQEDEAWDAFEAWEGQPLLRAPSRAVGWSTVRGWLADLCAEITAGDTDGEPPMLTLDRVWIADDGRAKLLDWPAAGVTSPPCAGVHSPGVTFAAAQPFLHDVARSALGLGDPRRGPIPLRAANLLRDLERGAFTSGESLMAALGATQHGRDRPSRWQRALHLGISGFLPLVTTVMMVVAVASATLALQGRPDLFVLSDALTRLGEIQSVRGARTSRDAEQEHALETLIAGPLRRAVGDPRIRTVQAVPFFPPLLVRRAERIVATTPPASADDVKAARATLGSFLEKSEREAADDASRGVAWSRFALPTLMLFGFAALPALACALAFRGGACLRLFGFAVVTSVNAEASRVRTTLRALIAWSPALAGWLFGLIRTMMSPRPPVTVPLLVVLAVLLLVFGVGAVIAVVTPARGLQDRLAGTFLVPR